MAQLIKLKDYISRYEVDIYQYPSQYIKLKNDHWKKAKINYEQGWIKEEMEQYSLSSVKKEENRKGWKNFFKKKQLEDVEQEETGLAAVPSSIEELKHDYLDGLIPFQLKWATTTLQEKSFASPFYKENTDLKYFLQRFPDTYLLMFSPIAQIKKAEVEIDHLLITPTGVDIISCVNHLNGGVIYPKDEMNWSIKEKGGHLHKIRNPQHSLRRTESFVKSVLNKYQLDFPCRKIILAKGLYFGSGNEPYQTDWIGKERYVDWFRKKRNMKAPLKHEQLKVAGALLKHCRTISVKRPEWDFDDD
ncbi:Nuclease-related domain-containing protein [Halobacillus karajensis]|uniref:NERD domain-containing protein n=1 Tax=Halobacillus karajensis TaxID=195088 RepID=A0A024P6Q1_9BACI|nr:nuclease-related domain-containing protein [Halobacillus karajensis]CDQ18345.1 hypothetical protein BN982_00606 [Halobacillus karajensis]CDQ24699.1 hypothetical protein BN983_02994 [Halobacillus karajensis]CDQ29055.1 hypothetical protein BN981_03415 [Halobacillus karajensis]SEI06669.1 Nuclease-related domain-containing protein [Halobacillus karajensis]